MLMQIIKARHSIRKYIDKQISRGDLELILEAGNYAPNAGGGQRSMIVGIRDKALTTKLGISSCIISRGEETFDNPEGAKLLKSWGVPENYSCICFVIFGYIDVAVQRPQPIQIRRKLGQLPNYRQLPPF